MEELPEVCVGNGGHVFEIAALKLLPADLSVAVEVHVLELALELSHQLVLHEVVRDEDHDRRLELVHLAEIANRLEFATHMQPFLPQLTPLPTPLPYPGVSQRLLPSDSQHGVVGEHPLDQVFGRGTDLAPFLLRKWDFSL